MKFYFLLIAAFYVLMPSFVMAQADNNQTADEKAIRQVVQNIADAWAAGDGEKYADNFTDDVDYTVWNGMYFSGREANKKNHQQIFDTFYKGTKLKIEVRKIRFLNGETAVVHLQSEMFKGGKEVEDVPKVVPLMILEKKDGKWKVVVFQNTPVIGVDELIVKRKVEQK